MLTPTQFTERWNEPLAKLDLSDAVDAKLPQQAITFLVEAGLPFGCAPFLSFGPFTGGLKYIDGVFNFSPKRLNPQEKDRLSMYPMIGFDGEGSPICVDIARSGRVVILDHDADFQPVLFVNSTVPQLAECLLIYRTLVEVILAENGEAALMDGNIPEYAKPEAVAQMTLADPDAMNPDCFWLYEINSFGVD